MDEFSQTQTETQAQTKDIGMGALKRWGDSDKGSSREKSSSIQTRKGKKVHVETHTRSELNLLGLVTLVMQFHGKNRS